MFWKEEAETKFSSLSSEGHRERELL